MDEGLVNFPLHYAVWTNQPELLERSLSIPDVDVEQKDSQGHTALQLAALRNNTECVIILLNSRATPDVEDGEGWSVLHECIAAGNYPLAQRVFQKREQVRSDDRARTIPELLNKLSNAPDFYVEMKWDFTSWVPLVSRMCPSDTYRIYKSGPAVRIDSTLIGFEENSWQRGNITFLFLANHTGCEFHEIDHEKQTIFVERIKVDDGPYTGNESVSTRMASPLVSTQLKTDNIEFWREKAGIIGFRQDKTEDISGYQCAVYSTAGVEVLVRTRVEHLSQAQREALNNNVSPLQSLLGTGPSTSDTMPEIVDETEEEHTEYTFTDYLTSLPGPLRSRKKAQSEKCQKFKARVWLSQEHPLSLQEQLLPIVELMSTSNSHFAKLKEFITLQLPAGFPVNIEIPLYHMVNARITFSNINSASSPVEGVLCLTDEPVDGARANTTCVVDSSIFIPPPYATRLGNSTTTHQNNLINDDELLQLAIERSLLPDSAPLLPLPDVTPPVYQNHYELDEEVTWADALNEPLPDMDSDLALALQLSREDENSRQARLLQEEEEELARIIALSLQET